MKVPTSIDATGERDVTDPLTAFFAAVPAGSTVELPAGARYRVEGTVEASLRRVDVQAQGATIFATTKPLGVTAAEKRKARDRCQFRHTGSEDVNVYDLRLDGGNVTGGVDYDWDDRAAAEANEGNHCYAFRGSKRINHYRCSAKRSFGDLVYIGDRLTGTATKASNHVHSEDIRFYGGRFEHAGRHGLTPMAVDGVCFFPDYIGDVCWYTVTFETRAPFSGASDVWVGAEVVGPAGQGFMVRSGSGPVRDVVVAGSRFDGMAVTVLVSPDSGAVTEGFYFHDLTSNLPYGSKAQAPMRFTRLAGLQLRNVHQPMQKGRSMYLASTVNCSGADIDASNTVPNGLGLVKP